MIELIRQIRARLYCLAKPCDISHLTKSGWLKLQDTDIFVKWNIYSRVLTKESLNSVYPFLYINLSQKGKLRIQFFLSDFWYHMVLLGSVNGPLPGICPPLWEPRASWGRIGSWWRGIVRRAWSLARSRSCTWTRWWSRSCFRRPSWQRTTRSRRS